MNMSTDTLKIPVNQPLPDLEKLAGVLGHTARWRMLRELSTGETRSIAELTTVAGCSYESAVRHLVIMREAGLIEQGRGRLYQIAPARLPIPGQRLVDFGHCLLRLDAAG